MPVSKSWLQEFTLPKLHRLAVALGVTCSGTKAERINSIQRAVSNVRAGDSKKGALPKLSLLSIDMGIKNLAFAHLTAPLQQAPGSSDYLHYGKPTLQQWRRIAVSESQHTGDPGSVPSVAGSSTEKLSKPPSVQPMETTAESFEPVDFARHAYNLIDYMIDTYQPTHVIIERQRFRSGGGSAVQEWTIRVGVFEGMLYSVLQTLVSERKMCLTVEPVQPARVNRYWLEGHQNSSLPSSKKLVGREVKKAKIDLVSDMIKEGGAQFHITTELQPFAGIFVSSCAKSPKSKSAMSASMSKLDDLADSVLQGLAWIDWQNNRRHVDVLGRDGVDVESGAVI